MIIIFLIYNATKVDEINVCKIGGFCHIELWCCPARPTITRRGQRDKQLQGEASETNNYKARPAIPTITRRGQRDQQLRGEASETNNAKARPARPTMLRRYQEDRPWQSIITKPTLTIDANETDHDKARPTRPPWYGVYRRLGITYIAASVRRILPLRYRSLRFVVDS